MRINQVKSAQKDTGRNCLGCGKPVVKGEAYQWFAPFRASKRVRHLTCGSFKASETASNDKLSALYEAIESAEDAIAQLDVDFSRDDAQQILDDCADAIDEVAEQYEESASNIEDGFGHETELSAQMNDNAEQLRDFASTVRDALDDVDEFDEQSAIDEFVESIEDDDEYSLDRFDSIEKQAQFINEKRDDYVAEKCGENSDAMRGAMNDAIAECPL